MIPPLHIEDTLTSIKTIVKDLTDVIGLFKKNADSWFALHKSIKKKREIYKLEKILHALTRMNHQQRQIPEYLRWLADDIDKFFSIKETKLDEFKEAKFWLVNKEARLSEYIEDIQALIVDLHEFIDTNQPLLLERSPSIYDKIIDTLYQRELFFSGMSWGSDTSTQFTLGDAALLRSFADEYDILISKLKEYRQLVATFLNKVDK